MSLFNFSSSSFAIVVGCGSASPEVGPTLGGAYKSRTACLLTRGVHREAAKMERDQQEVVKKQGEGGGARVAEMKSKIQAQGKDPSLEPFLD